MTPNELAAAIYNYDDDKPCDDTWNSMHLAVRELLAKYPHHVGFKRDQPEVVLKHLAQMTREGKVLVLGGLVALFAEEKDAMFFHLMVENE